MSNQPLLTANKVNDFQTPDIAVYPLLKYIPKDWTVWECACGKGNIARLLESRGNKVIATDIKKKYDFHTKMYNMSIFLDIGPSSPLQ
jgi:2-polyprenyl-3-methyl-5-hydroxy-6-metoxy-1,4-benzoquinol methylase